MSRDPGPLIHLVLRNHWEADEGRFGCIHDPGEGYPVAAYHDAERAAARCETLEHLERVKVNPLLSPHPRRGGERRGAPGPQWPERLIPPVAASADDWPETWRRLALDQPPERLREL